jgi:hypothetical protein
MGNEYSDCKNYDKGTVSKCRNLVYEKDPNEFRNERKHKHLDIIRECENCSKFEKLDKEYR